MTENTHDLALKIAKALSDKKGKDVIIIDVKNKTVIADYFVIASAKSTTAVKALADNVEEKLSKEESREPLRRDGFAGSTWIAMDYGSDIVHVFHDEAREYYRLERLWMDGENCERIED